MPSVAELLEQTRGVKALTRVIGRDQRAKVIEIERQVHELAENVDRSTRCWDHATGSSMTG